MSSKANVQESGILQMFKLLNLFVLGEILDVTVQGHVLGDKASYSEPGVRGRHCLCDGNLGVHAGSGIACKG